MGGRASGHPVSGEVHQPRPTPEQQRLMAVLLSQALAGTVVVREVGVSRGPMQHFFATGGKAAPASRRPVFSARSGAARTLCYGAGTSRSRVHQEWSPSLGGCVLFLSLHGLRVKRLIG